MRRLSSISGASLISVALATAVAGGTALAISQAVRGLGSSGSRSYEVNIANALAIELLEYFIAMKPDHLRQVLGTNPINPNRYNGYPLCAPINLLDRSSARGSIINRDPVAALPPDSPLISANRHYRVEVIDLSDPANLTSRRDLCGRDPKYVNLERYERFAITVGLTWKAKDNGELLSTSVTGAISDPVETPVPTPQPPCSGRVQVTGDPHEVVRRVNAMIPNTADVFSTSLRYNAETVQKVCEVLGHPNVMGYGNVHRDGRVNYTSPHNNYLVRWDSATNRWITEGASGGQWLTTIDCRCAGDNRRSCTSQLPATSFPDVPYTSSGFWLVVEGPSNPRDWGWCSGNGTLTIPADATNLQVRLNRVWADDKGSLLRVNGTRIWQDTRPLVGRGDDLYPNSDVSSSFRPGVNTISGRGYDTRGGYCGVGAEMTFTYEATSCNLGWVNNCNEAGVRCD